MRRIALALSPHLDDAAFSCGGTLAMLAERGWRVVVATVFTASVPDPQGFALACQLDKGLPASLDYMALRRGEDASACAALGAATPVHLPFPEAPHRGYGSAPDLFGPPRSDDAIAGPLADAVRDLVDAHGPDLILAPQAIGGHVDHVLLALALERVQAPGTTVLRWADFPYAAREGRPAEPFGKAMRNLPEHRFTLTPAAARAKRAACLAYASQIGFQFGGAAGLDAKLAATGACEGFRGRPPLDGEAFFLT